MTRAGAWLRSTGHNTSDNTHGFIPLAIIASGQTVDRILWAFNCSNTLSSTTAFPPGSSFVKAGLWIGAPALGVVPNPVDSPTESFLDVMTCPWRGNIATSTNIDYLCFAGFGGPDKEAKARRLNDTGSNMQLYVTWQSVKGFDFDPTFTFFTTASTDAYVLDPA